jgi:serine/threonine protein kinase
MAQPYDEDLKIGDRIAGRYEILAVIGQGSMGVVYKCRHDILGRTVAIKTLRMREHNSDDRSQKRFEREARLASRLDHANLISVHDFGYTASGDPYLVMDFVSGQTLFDIMKRERYLIAERAVNLFSQVCDGLFHAHQRGVIHRDLKPANIMVVKNENLPETVKLVDLGVAKIVQGEDEGEAITMTGEVCGSPIYLSPEQCMYQELDPRTDIYSLGVCLYECLMGQPPLRGSSVYDTIYMHVHEMPRPFSAIAGGNPEVPRQLEEVVLRCLAKRPDDRYETMLQLKQELLASLNPQHEISSVKVLPPELLFGNAAASGRNASGEVDIAGSFAAEPPRPGQGFSPGSGRSTGSGFAAGSGRATGSGFAAGAGRATGSGFAAVSGQTSGSGFEPDSGSGFANGAVQANGSAYAGDPYQAAGSVKHAQEHQAEIARTGKKISGELSKPTPPVEPHPPAPPRNLPDAHGAAGQAKRSPSAASAAEKPAGSKSGSKIPVRRPASPSEKGGKKSGKALAEHLGLHKIVVIASAGSILIGLGIGFGFAYFLTAGNQQNHETAVNPPSGPAGLQPAPFNPPPDAASSLLNNPDNMPNAAMSGKNKNPGALIIAGKKHRTTVTDLSQLLPDDTPMSGQGSQNKYFSIVKNPPVRNTGMGHGPMPMGGRSPLAGRFPMTGRLPMSGHNPLVARSPMSGQSPAFRGGQGAPAIKGNAFMEQMRQFAISQGMPLPGGQPSQQSQGQGNPLVGGSPAGQLPAQQTPPAELWRRGGSLLQQPDASQQQSGGNNTEQATALCNEATTLCQNNQYAAACQKFEAAYRLDPGNQQVKLLYAWALNSQALEFNKQQRYSQAVEYSKKAVSLAPEKEVYHKNLANFSHNLEAQQSGSL